MPTGRNFLISVVGTPKEAGPEVRSPWVQAATLSPKDRNMEMG
eukprot:CAMPEP_0204567086 /NCGR_PEP_ID=MMETSP0661-20131031/36407_1 /ASSEMBLY_ACC=CAM_ASM_000606 /TAXON_ID=109239 /ORGANISM="Alexandrium margalefi, Strain AMGDE01CS-322" /LENGTH=42 /DNA_ID= /DNA_START= /DNA_END= /DNA_ORIENTATION=